MIRAFPQSLFGRNVMLLMVSIVVSVSLSFISIYALILNAQLNRVTGIVAELINTVSSASYEMEPEAKFALIAELDGSQYLQILPPGVVPEISDVRETAIEKAYMQRLIDQLEYQNEMDWRIGENRTLWLYLRIGDEFYWFAAESSTTWTPLRWLTLIMFVVVGVVTLIGIIATRQITKPLAALKQETDEWSLNSNREMATVRGPTEVAALANSFQRMAERLRKAETVRAETLAELSHDLRTPLARLRLAVEMIIESDDLKDSVSRQVQQIDRLIGQFMDYARGGRSEPKEVFDLSALIADVADKSEIDTDIEANLSLNGQKEFIRRALINLIENAQKYGALPVQIKLIKTGSHAVIDVSDMGEGFAIEETQELLQSFSRGRHSKQISGSGLGLAIVDRVAAAHDGEIMFSKADAAGFCASLRLAL